MFTRLLLIFATTQLALGLHVRDRDVVDRDVVEAREAESKYKGFVKNLNKAFRAGQKGIKKFDDITEKTTYAKDGLGELTGWIDNHYVTEGKRMCQSYLKASKNYDDEERRKKWFKDKLGEHDRDNNGQLDDDELAAFAGDEEVQGIMDADKDFTDHVLEELTKSYIDKGLNEVRKRVKKAVNHIPTTLIEKYAEKGTAAIFKKLGSGVTICYDIMPATLAGDDEIVHRDPRDVLDDTSPDGIVDELSNLPEDSPLMEICDANNDGKFDIHDFDGENSVEQLVHNLIDDGDPNFEWIDDEMGLDWDEATEQVAQDIVLEIRTELETKEAERKAEEEERQAQEAREEEAQAFVREFFEETGCDPLEYHGNCKIKKAKKRVCTGCGSNYTPHKLLELDEMNGVGSGANIEDIFKLRDMSDEPVSDAVAEKVVTQLPALYTRGTNDFLRSGVSEDDEVGLDIIFQERDPENYMTDSLLECFNGNYKQMELDTTEQGCIQRKNDRLKATIAHVKANAITYQPKRLVRRGVGWFAGWAPTIGVPLPPSINRSLQIATRLESCNFIRMFGDSAVKSCKLGMVSNYAKARSDALEYCGGAFQGYFVCSWE